MNKINLIGFDTRLGFRTTELAQGDMTALSPAVDVLVVSVFSGSYYPTEGTLIRALQEQHGINARELAARPALDFREALGVWLSQPLEAGPARRLLFVEMGGSGRDLEDAVDNIFAALTAMDSKRIPVTSIAMPLLGAGSQRLDPETVANTLLPRVRDYLERSASTTKVLFVELDAGRAEQVSLAMDAALGRVRVSVPHEELAEALRADVLNRFSAAGHLFQDNGTTLRQDWMGLLKNENASSTEFGVLARKFVEMRLNVLGISRGQLPARIRELELTGKVPPWICGYMQVLRHLGNEAAHTGAGQPADAMHAVTPSDLIAGLYCVQRLLDQWISGTSKN